MLVLRLLVMVLAIICLMDGHAEVSSSTTGIRDRRESPAVKTNELEVEVLDRKKKKKPKPSKKKKPKPGKKKPKPNKAKPKPTKPVTTTTTMSTSTLKTTTILTTPTITTTATTTTTTVSPTTTETTVKTTTSTASATTTLSTTTSATTSATTTSVETSSTASTTTTTIPTTATTSSLSTTAATTADSGAGGECKATNGKPCIFPFIDGKEYNECKNEGGKYFWCATSVYDSGKYKHWSYCSTDGPCPLEGDGECRAENNKPCVFPFKDGNKEYNECADFGGKYFWCATGTNSAGKYTAWSECPKDGSCPLSGQGTMPTTSTTTTASTTPPTNDTSAAAIAIANVENALTEINDTLQNLETAGFSEDEKQLLETMNDLSNYMESGSPTRNWNLYDAVKINSMTQQLYSTTAKIKASKQVNPGFKSAHQSADAACSIKVKNAKLSEAKAGPGRMFKLHTISKILGIVTNIPSSSACCAECKIKATDSELFEHSNYYKECYCFKTKSGVTPETTSSITINSDVCLDEGVCSSMRAFPTLTNADCPTEFPLVQGSAVQRHVINPFHQPVNDPWACARKCLHIDECDAIITYRRCPGGKRFCALLTSIGPVPDKATTANDYCLDAQTDTLLHYTSDSLLPSAHFNRLGVNIQHEGVLRELRDNTILCATQRNDRINGQAAFIAVIPKSVVQANKAIAHVQTYFSTKNPLGAVGVNERCNKYYRHIDQTLVRPNPLHTEPPIFQLLYNIINSRPNTLLQDPNDGVVSYLYTFNNPCIEHGAVGAHATQTNANGVNVVGVHGTILPAFLQGGQYNGLIGARGCSDQIYREARNLHQNIRPVNQNSLHVGFDFWWDQEWFGYKPWHSLTQQPRYACNVARNNFCAKMDHFKQFYGINRRHILSFIKFNIENHHGCGDNTFSPTIYSAC